MTEQAADHVTSVTRVLIAKVMPPYVYSYYNNPLNHSWTSITRGRCFENWAQFGKKRLYKVGGTLNPAARWGGYLEDVALYSDVTLQFI